MRQALGVFLWILAAPFVVLFALAVNVMAYGYALVIYPFFAVLALMCLAIGEINKAREFMMVWYECYKEAMGKGEKDA